MRVPDPIAVYRALDPTDLAARLKSGPDGLGTFDFVPLPGALVATILAITILYVVAAEMTKAWFYRHAREYGPAPWDRPSRS